MTNDSIPPAIREFIFRYIDSVELLNVLLLLQANPEKQWTKSEITSELRSSNGSIAKRLNDLYHREILINPKDSDSRHQFTPASETLRQQINSLAEFYRLKPYTVIELIYSRPSEVLKAFADAFKFKGGN